MHVKIKRAISQESPEDMARNVKKYVEEGYRKFQLKVGGDPRVDIHRIIEVRKTLDDFTKNMKIPHMPLFCDANTGEKLNSICYCNFYI